MNVNLKFRIYEKYRTQSDAAKVFGMREDRLSQIIRGRRNPNDVEKRLIVEKLDTTVDVIFPEPK